MEERTHQLVCSMSEVIFHRQLHMVKLNQASLLRTQGIPKQHLGIGLPGNPRYLRIQSFTAVVVVLLGSSSRQSPSHKM